MRLRLATGAAAAVAIWAPSLPAAHAAPGDELAAKEAEARAVLEEVSALDARFERTVETWNQTRIALAQSTARLASNRRQLVRARARSREADERRAERLREIYVHGTPGTLELVLATGGLSDLLDSVKFVQTLAALDRRVALRARDARLRLAEAERRLGTEQAVTRRALAGLTRSRRHIGEMLARRQQLLRSIEAEVAAIREREAREQAARRAAALARLERERREAQERAGREQEARARAAERAKARAVAPPPPTAATPPPTTSAAVSPLAATVAQSPPEESAAGAAPAVLPDPGPGHAAAATGALAYVGVRYRWGGDSPKTGFDCSGLVLYVYAQLGVDLPHSAAAQYGLGEPVARDGLQPGDLVFFRGLGHVGIYVGGGQMVHAPRSGDVVKISPVFEPSRQYVGARRI